jgi:hypothetical protein
MEVSKKNVAKTSTCYLFHVAFLLDLFFDPKHRGDMFLRNIGWLSAGYTSLYPASYIFFNGSSSPFRALASDFQFRNHFTQTVGLLGRVISPSQGPTYIQVNTDRINAYTPNIHALSGIGTQDSSVWASAVYALDHAATVTSRKIKV